MREAGGDRGFLKWEFQGVLTLRDKDENEYKYLQFHVPQGYDAIEASYEYSRSSECVIDIGIIDPDGCFRGWSGSDKPVFSISAGKATPGYVAGEVHPGAWSIILGLAKIPPEGCRYRVLAKASRLGGHACVNRVLEESVTPLSVPKPACALAPGWIRGDLHVHSHHSDGKHSVRGLVAKAVE